VVALAVMAIFEVPARCPLAAGSAPRSRPAGCGPLQAGSPCSALSWWPSRTSSTRASSCPSEPPRAPPAAPLTAHSQRGRAARTVGRHGGRRAHRRRVRRRGARNQRGARGRCAGGRTDRTRELSHQRGAGRPTDRACALACVRRAATTGARGPWWWTACCCAGAPRALFGVRRARRTAVSATSASRCGPRPRPACAADRRAPQNFDHHCGVGGCFLRAAVALSPPPLRTALTVGNCIARRNHRCFVLMLVAGSAALVAAFAAAVLALVEIDAAGGRWANWRWYVDIVLAIVMGYFSLVLGCAPARPAARASGGLRVADHNARQALRAIAVRADSERADGEGGAGPELQPYRGPGALQCQRHRAPPGRDRRRGVAQAVRVFLCRHWTTFWCESAVRVRTADGGGARQVPAH
jgi:hypothetical protein